jgi:hypothetical protein
MTYDGPERRKDPTKPDTGLRRRKVDIAERQAEFRLFRDKVLLALGVIIVLGVGLAAVFVQVRNQSLALAALTAGAGLLGAPVALRLDERRRENGGS